MSPSLLIVEDDATMRSLLELIFSLRGYEVFSARNVPEGLAVVADHHVDGVLTDLELPGPSGLELCRAVAEQRKFGVTARLWVMSGAVRRELFAEAMAAGASGVLQKPFNVDAFCRQFEATVAREAVGRVASPEQHEVG